MCWCFAKRKYHKQPSTVDVEEVNEDFATVAESSKLLILQ